MRKLFNPDNPFMQFLTRIADYFIVNFFVVLLSFPIITMGAAITAANKVMQDFQFDNEQPVMRSFFKSFAQNFKQSTLVWLLVLLAALLLFGDLILVYVYVGGYFKLIMFALLGSACIVVLGAAFYAFSLIARYENTLKQHLRNSVLLAIGHLPKTILILLLYASPILLCLLPEGEEALARTLATVMVVFSIFGFSLLVHLQTRLLKPVLMKLEEKPEELPQIEDSSSEGENQEVTL